MMGLFKLIVPRYLFYSVQKNVLLIELHGFCDSSMKAYSALCYIRVITKNGIFVNLLYGKAKVAPLKKISILRLELLSCVLLANLLKNVKNAINENFEITNIFYWSDSEISLYWIRSIEKEWKQWVENKVNFIRNLTDYKSWYYVSTKVNAADLPTRNSDIKCLQKNDSYWHSPQSLLKNSENWPVQKFTDINEECKNEYYQSVRQI